MPECPRKSPANAHLASKDPHRAVQRLQRPDVPCLLSRPTTKRAVAAPPPHKHTDQGDELEAEDNDREGDNSLVMLFARVGDFLDLSHRLEDVRIVRRGRHGCTHTRRKATGHRLAGAAVRARATGPPIWPHSVVLQAAALSCGLRTIARPLAPPTRQIRILTSMSAGTQRAGAGLCASPDPARRIGLHHHAHVPRPKRRPALCSLSCNPLPRPLPEDPRIRQFGTMTGHSTEQVRNSCITTEKLCLKWGSLTSRFITGTAPESCMGARGAQVQRKFLQVQRKLRDRHFILVQPT